MQRFKKGTGVENPNFKCSADMERRRYITQVCLCLDNDEPGQKAAHRISRALADKNIRNRILIPTRKDWNEDLLFLRKEEAK